MYFRDVPRALVTQGVVLFALMTSGCLASAGEQDLLTQAQLDRLNEAQLVINTDCGRRTDGAFYTGKLKSEDAVLRLIRLGQESPDGGLVSVDDDGSEHDVTVRQELAEVASTLEACDRPDQARRIDRALEALPPPE